MAISVSCSNCGRVVYASEKDAGKTKPCPGCGYSLTIPTDPSLHTEKPTTKDCPQCGNRLRLIRQFHGKHVRCTKCGVVLSVSADPWRLSVVGIPSAISPGGRLEESLYVLPDDTPPTSTPMTDGHSPQQPRLPPGMPPMPATDGTFDFLNKNVDDAEAPGALAKAVQSLNLTDMFLGKEKEHVFHLLPGEERLDELMIHHHHFFVVRKGITRVTLTNQRVLYTTTRVFSPFYWLLLVLFPPLVIYYAIRISRNRNVSLPLDSIDSIEKHYRPNWLVFFMVVILGYMVATLCGRIVAIVFGGAQQQALLSQSPALEWVVAGIVAGLLSPIVLISLLASRSIGIELRSRNNQFFIRYGPEDRGVYEGKMDVFLQKVHAEVKRARTLLPESKASLM
jgi:hypothetical protein